MDYVVFTHGIVLFYLGITSLLARRQTRSLPALWLAGFAFSCSLLSFFDILFIRSTALTAFPYYHRGLLCAVLATGCCGAILPLLHNSRYARAAIPTGGAILVYLTIAGGMTVGSKTTPMLWNIAIVLLLGTVLTVFLLLILRKTREMPVVVKMVVSALLFDAAISALFSPSHAVIPLSPPVSMAVAFCQLVIALGLYLALIYNFDTPYGNRDRQGYHGQVTWEASMVFVIMLTSGWVCAQVFHRQFLGSHLLCDVVLWLLWSNGFLLVTWRWSREGYFRQLLDSESRARMLVEGSLNWVSFLTADGVILSVNQPVLDILQWPSERIVGATIHGVFASHEDGERCLQAWQRICAGEQATFLARIAREDGALVTWKITLNPIRNTTVQRAQVVLIASDVTAQAQIEDALRTSEASYHSVMNALPDYICRFREDGTILGVHHPADADPIRLSAESIGHHLSESLDSESANLFEHQIRRTLETADVQIFDYRCNLPKGACAFEVRMVAYAEKEVLAILRNITGKKRAEEALWYRMGFEELMMNLSTHFINLHSSKSDAGIRYALSQIGLFEGVDRAQLVFFSASGEVIEGYYEWCANAIERNTTPLAGTAVARLPWLMEQLQATEPLHISSAAEIPPAGYAEGWLYQAQFVKSLLILPLLSHKTLVGFLGFESIDKERTWSSDSIALFTIVGEMFLNALLRKRSEEQISLLNTQLQRQIHELHNANKELESFSYSVSHDLRAPLRTIDGFSQALIEEYSDQLDLTGQDYVKRVRSACKRMGEFIEALLGLSRINRSELSYEPLNLSDMALDILTELQCAQPERNVETAVAPVTTVYGDRRLLRLALENLLGNAWKFTQNSPYARIEFGEQMQNGQQVFFVRDNGAGFDMMYANKLFVPFQRLHSATEFPGTGIGLVTIHRIITRHGGSIWAEGVRGHGATFFFSIPSKPLCDPSLLSRQDPSQDAKVNAISLPANTEYTSEVTAIHHSTDTRRDLI